MATPGTAEGRPRPRRRTVQRVPTPSSSPEYRAISPPWNTQELAASATAPRSNRGASGTAEQAIPIDEDDDDEPAAAPVRPANATPIRPANSNVNGQLQSALRSNKKTPGSAQSVRISENARNESEDIVNDNGIEPEDNQLDSSPMSEPLPRRARIRHSLLPRDEDGKLSVRADVMEQRARVIVTVAQDAIQASLRKELEEVPEGEDIPWIDLEKIWEALDSNQLYIFNFKRSPLFMSTQTVEEDVQLENNQQVSLFDAVSSLRPSITLRNLANLLRVLLEPDKGVNLLPDDAVLAEADHAEKLNILFGHAWNAFLATCIPRMRWSSRAAVGLLVDMATQRFMMGYGRWCEMPELDDEAVEELHAIFSDDAVRQNAYEISTHWDNDDVDETLRNLDREWQRAVKIRIDEILAATPGQLDDLFPFNAFRHEALLQINQFIQGTEPLEGLLPEQHFALGQAVQHRGIPDPVVTHADVTEDHNAEVALDDDDAVDLLTQTQRVSGRSDPEEVLNPALHQDIAEEEPINGDVDIAAPETLESYEELAQDPDVGAIEQEEESVPVNQLNGSLEATQTLGLADLEAFMDGDEEEEEVESEEEIEGEEPTQGQENGSIAQPEADDLEPNGNDNLSAVVSIEATLGDATAIDIEQETLEITETAETVEVVETQESWDIRRGKDQPVRPEQIIRGRNGKSVPGRQIPLNAPQPDAVRMQWEDSQEQSGNIPQPVSNTAVEPPRALRSAKRAKTAGNDRERDEEQQESASEAQSAAGVETAEERRARKGKAPVRPDLRSNKGSVKTPGKGPVWESVQPAKRLVTDDESSNTDDSGSEFQELDSAEQSARRQKAGRKVLANALFGPSRSDVPVVRKSHPNGVKGRSGTASSTARATSASTVAPSPRKKRRVVQGVTKSFMDDYVDNDLFMVDADGEPLFDDNDEPLKEDPSYMASVPNRKRPGGKTVGKAPRLEWTDKDKLLLYREIQKCPINAKSAFVSAVLYRYGDPTSDDSPDTFVLAQSMQLRDQMKDIVKLRTARDMPVVGNARFFLPPSDPRKVAFDDERAAANDKDDQEERNRLLAKLRADAIKEQTKQAKKAKKRKRKDSEDESTADEDELVEDEEEQPVHVAENEEQDELEIENEIGDGDVRDEGQSADEDGSAQPSAANEGSAQPQEDTSGDVQDAEEEPSTEPAPAAQPTRVLRNRRGGKK